MAAKGDARRQRILEYIQAHLNQHGYPPSVREIGAAVGLQSPASVARHLRRLEENGQISHTPMKRRAWRVDRPQLETYTIPLIGQIRAGQPQLAQEQIEEQVVLPLSLFHPAAQFLLRVHGDSMVEAGILPDDWVAVASQSHAGEGDIVIALMGDEATVKRFHREGDVIHLLPANPRYDPIITRDVTIVGRVVGVIRAY